MKRKVIHVYVNKKGSLDIPIDEIVALEDRSVDYGRWYVILHLRNGEKLALKLYDDPSLVFDIFERVVDITAEGFEFRKQSVEMEVSCYGY